MSEKFSGNLSFAVFTDSSTAISTWSRILFPPRPLRRHMAEQVRRIVKYPVNQEEGEWAGDGGDVAASYEIRPPFSALGLF